MTDTEKVALVQKLISEYWAYSAGDIDDTAATLLNSISIVLEFKPEEDNNG